MPPRKFFCTFPENLISEPIISFTLGDKFGVVPNIRAASITDTMALVAVEIEGSEENIEKAVVYMRELGVRVEEIAEGDDLPTP
ncbi:MAG: ferredoxin [bacterium]|nr:ferredoxin [bacterium]